MTVAETTDDFAGHRGLLMGVAYRVLGRVTDAEDVVQEAWLRWSTVDSATVADPKAYLIRVTTRLAIDRLRRIQTRRESYVGPWLPEPLLTSPDIADEVTRAEQVSLAMLVVLETLSPLERAVFVLRESFGMPYAEIADALGKSEPAVRQLTRRARAHVQERRPRFDVDQRIRQEVTARFFLTCQTGDMESLLRLLAPGVSLVGDGGGHAKAPRQVINGPDKVARFILAIIQDKGMGAFLTSIGLDPTERVTLNVVQANGGPAGVIVAAGRPITFVQLDVADGLVQTIYLATNPAKLTGLMSQPARVLRP